MDIMYVDKEKKAFPEYQLGFVKPQNVNNIGNCLLQFSDQHFLQYQGGLVNDDMAKS